jgi:hypothetical protein
VRRLNPERPFLLEMRDVSPPTSSVDRYEPSISSPGHGIPAPSRLDDSVPIVETQNRYAAQHIKSYMHFQIGIESIKSSALISATRLQHGCSG